MKDKTVWFFGAFMFVSGLFLGFNLKCIIELTLKLW